ncbi:MAG: Fe-S-containing hydro-lyase [Oscillospiraceae bacterium]|jgi:fumarate hydratase subunit beta|nr:Fe-S-containing hydro-lyase [Oscillospiraceae bacterium]
MLLRITAPLLDEVIERLHSGDMLAVSGVVYTGRDAAHRRMTEALARGEALPFDPTGQIIYYAGPCPAPPGRVIGSIGPTTSGRMDAYAPALIRCGLKAMIGKGPRSPEVVEAIRTCGGVYFAAVGGAAALMSRCVKQAEVVAYPDLGTEAIRRLVVEDLPVVVAVDCRGGCVYDVTRADAPRPFCPRV